MKVVRDAGGEYRVPLPMRLDLANHSPTGFEWGYPGSGPTQLALAIMADAIGDEKTVRIYQLFKHDVVAKFDHAGFEIPVEEVRGYADLAFARLQ